AASFVTLRPSAKLAFLVLGPMLDFKLYLMYTRVFRPRLIWTIYVCVISQVFIFSYAVHLVWEKYAPQWINPVRQDRLRVPPAPFAVAARTTALLGTPAGYGPLHSISAAVVEYSSEEAPEMSFLDLEMAALTAEQRSFY